MEHQDWIDSMAAESYTLGELEPAKQDAFEEHFFDCPICSNDVRDAAKLVAGIRTRDVRAITPAAPRLKWLAAAAAAVVVAAGLSYQSFWKGHPTLATAGSASLADVITLESASRGTNEPVVGVIHSDAAVVLTFAIETDQPQAFYTCEVQDAGGRTRASLSVPRAKASERITMVLQPHTLSGGNYKLVIRGGEREIAAYPFTVEVR
jgi:hypothetical protein